MTINVAVLGAKGRMGAETVKAITATTDLKLVAQLDLAIHSISSPPPAHKSWLISLTQMQ